MEKCLQLFGEKSYLTGSSNASDTMAPLVAQALRFVHWNLTLASAECMAPSSPRATGVESLGPYTSDGSPSSFSFGRYFPDHHGLPATLDLDTPDSGVGFVDPTRHPDCRQRPCRVTATIRPYQTNSVDPSDCVTAINRRWNRGQSPSMCHDRFDALYGKHPKQRCLDRQAQEGHAPFSLRFLELIFLQLSQTSWKKGQDPSSCLQYPSAVKSSSSVNGLQGYGGQKSRKNNFRIVGTGKLRRVGPRESLDQSSTSPSCSSSSRLPNSEAGGAAYSISVDSQTALKSSVLKSEAEKRQSRFLEPAVSDEVPLAQTVSCTCSEYSSLVSTRRWQLFMRVCALNQLE